MGVLRWGLPGAAGATALSQVMGGLIPLFWQLDGVWWSIVAAEVMAVGVSLLCILLKRKRYGYL